jgi:hypothetical protein
MLTGRIALSFDIRRLKVPSRASARCKLPGHRPRTASVPPNRRHSGMATFTFSWPARTSTLPIPHPLIARDCSVTVPFPTPFPIRLPFFAG